MKKSFKFLYSLLFASAALVFATSCSEDKMDDVNHNPNDPQEVPSRFIITNVINSYAISIIGSDLAVYSMSYSEQEVGTFNQLYKAEARTSDPTSSTTYNNTWGAVYSNLESLRIIIKMCSEGGEEEGNNSGLGIAQVMTAAHLGVLADMWGDAPWSEALKPNEILQPKLDKQEAIYADIISNLENGIINLAKSSSPAFAFGSQDMLFGGDVKKWTKYAYALLARHKMRLSLKNADYAGVISAVNSSFAKASEEAKLTIFEGMNYISPYAAFYDARDYMNASVSFAEKFKERNDPRLAEFNLSVDDISALVDMKIFTKTKLGKYGDGLAPNGTPEQVQQKYTLPTAAVDYSSPVYFISYHELLFIKAEAMQRNGASATDVKAALKEAVVAAFVKAGGIRSRVFGKTILTEEVAVKYFEDEVSSRFDENPLKEILNQKYMGLYQNGESLEIYSCLRLWKAMGNGDFITLKNPNVNKFPLRYTYGVDDVSANKNVDDAYGDGTYVYSEQVWWAGGTR